VALERASPVLTAGLAAPGEMFYKGQVAATARHTHSDPTPRLCQRDPHLGVQSLFSVTTIITPAYEENDEKALLSANTELKICFIITS